MSLLDPAMLAWEVPSAISGLVTAVGWVALHIRQSRTESYRRGQDAERVSSQQKALERLFGYLNEQALVMSSLRRRLEYIRDLINKKTDWIVPMETQAGEDGRGAPNPLKDVLEDLQKLGR